MQEKLPDVSWISLNQEWYSFQLHQHRDWLKSLDKNPVELESLFKDSMLLGKRFEKFVVFWFSNSPFFDLILNNKTLIRDGRTLGEIDLVVKEKSSNEYFHIELACKFYLSSINSEQWETWKGPNASDSLEQKMQKLKRQLEIFKTPEGMDVLKEFDIPKPHPVLFMKGYFFHHFSNIFIHKNPKFSSQNYCTGWYSRFSNMAEFPGKSGLWIKLQKQSWLSTNHSIDEFELMNGLELQKSIETHFKNEKRAVLVARVEKREDQLIELDRGFIVPENWPVQ